MIPNSKIGCKTCLSNDGKTEAVPADKRWGRGEYNALGLGIGIQILVAIFGALYL
jgi:hypothetical protein